MTAPGATVASTIGFLVTRRPMSFRVCSASSATMFFVSGIVIYWVPRLTVKVIFWPSLTVRPALGFCLTMVPAGSSEYSSSFCNFSRELYSEARNSSSVMPMKLMRVTSLRLEKSRLLELVKIK